MKMTFQEIRIIATGPCIANQLRDLNTICRRSWYIAAHVWKIYDTMATTAILNVFNPLRAATHYGGYSYKVS
jgi:hypothetical protein